LLGSSLEEIFRETNWAIFSRDELTVTEGHQAHGWADKSERLLHGHQLDSEKREWDLVTKPHCVVKIFSFATHHKFESSLKCRTKCTFIVMLVCKTLW
jgi:hypothetical protein